MSRNRPEYETEKPDPFPGAYTVRGWRGIAFHILGYEVQDEIDPETGENVSEWSGIKVRTGKLVAVMVGDDTRHLVDADDITRLRRSEYCGGCGQVGCGHDTGGEDDE